MLDALETRLTEAEKVELWREHCAIEAGAEPETALKFARSSIDLHRFVELLHAGCAAATAYEILA